MHLGCDTEVGWYRNEIQYFVGKKIPARANGADIDPIETQEWLDSLTAVISKDGSDRAHYLLKKYICNFYCYIYHFSLS